MRLPTSSPARSAVLAIALAALLTGCGGGGSGAPTGATLASTASPSVTATVSGATANIAFVTVQLQNVDWLQSARFTVAPKAGATAHPLSATLSSDYLRRNGYVANTGITVPVFGLYAGRANSVTVELSFNDGSSTSVEASVTTPALSQTLLDRYTPTVLMPRAPGSSLALDYFLIKSSVGPLVMDTDGELRWVSPLSLSGISSTFSDSGFVVGDNTTTTIYRMELDGRTSNSHLLSSNYINFHHNVEPGKQGLLMELDNASPPSAPPLEVSLADVSAAGVVLAEWNLETILRDYMTANGDDPSNFVRSGTDWFHNNSAIYDPASNTLIVSGREDFVIGLDYATSEIKWILGDPTKYWATFPSLRAKALTLAPGSLPPIGQHALSITHDGLLMLFNDGAPSFNQPAGEPAGQSLAYSPVSAYRLDLNTRTATEVWRYDHGQDISSDICSSAYELPDQGLLIDYATANQRTQMRLVAVNSSRSTVFDFVFPTTGCSTGWNTLPIDFTQIRLD
jgi:hypothetical protein